MPVSRELSGSILKALLEVSWPGNEDSSSVMGTKCTVPSENKMATKKGSKSPKKSLLLWKMQATARLKITGLAVFTNDPYSAAQCVCDWHTPDCGRHRTIIFVCQRVGQASDTATKPWVTVHPRLPNWPLPQPELSPLAFINMTALHNGSALTLCDNMPKSKWKLLSN